MPGNSVAAFSFESMKSLGLFLIVASISFGTLKAVEKDSTSKIVSVVVLDSLLQELRTPKPVLRVYNFWATWCKPCVLELPLFEAAHMALREKGVVITLVSLDFLSTIQKTLIPFVEKKKLQSRVISLNAPSDPNLWIDSISSKWGGSIPMTLIIKPNEVILNVFEQEFEENQLLDLITSFQKE